MDIELQAIAGATPFTPKFNDKAHKLSDKVDKNDVPFLKSFPYLNAPHDYAGATYKQTTSNTGGKPNGDDEKAATRGVLQLLQSTVQAIANILLG